MKALVKSSTNRSILILLVGIFILMSILEPRKFLTFSNMISMSYQLPLIAFLSIGMMISMLTGGINLAIIATANFTGIVTFSILQTLAGEATSQASILQSLIALGGGLIAALVIGAVMGYLIAYIEVPAILATLAVMILLQGINVVLTKGYTLSGFPSFITNIGNGTVGRIPIPIIILIVVCIILYVVLRKTVFGRSLYILGANPIAAKFSNINVRASLMGAYMLSAFFSALTAFIMIGQFNSVKANYAESYLLVAVLACFLGGVDPFGGTGKLTGMVLSVISLQLISTGVTILRMDPFFIQAMWGLIIIVLIVANKFGKEIKETRRLRTARLEQKSEEQESQVS
jgi:simple sugar transport system permease protein